MLNTLSSRLHTRLWLASVVAFAIFTLLVSWVVRQTTEPPLRAVVVRNTQGEIIGSGQARIRPADVLPDEDRPPLSGLEHVPYGKFGSGPEFIAQMDDGQILHIHMPRAARSFWTRPPNGFLWSLSLVALAMALATYPIIRRLTRRLEALQQGVQAWGRGNLAIRVPEQGHDEVGFLARQFNQTAGQIEALVQSHKSLLANASHELRTPITSIRAFSEILYDNQDLEEVDRQHYLGIVIKETERLSRLISQVLDLERYESGRQKLTLVKVVCSELIQDSLEAMDQLIKDKNITVKLEFENPQQIIICDRDKLMQVFLNLLSNALKFIEDHTGSIAIRSSVINDAIYFEVEDNGKGIPLEYQQIIFEKFFQR